MAENDSEQKREVSTTGSDKSGVGTPTKRAVAMIDEMKSPTRSLPLTGKNWAWPFFILVLAYIVGIAVGAMKSYTGGTTGANVGFLVATFFLGSLLGVVIYNLGKGLGARIAGYRLAYLCISGLCWDGSRAAHRFYFDGSQFLEIHSRYVPVDDNVDRDPLLMHITGLVIWAVVFVVFIVVGMVAVKSADLANVKWGMVYGAAFSGDYVIYQLCPFRQDYPSDIFALASTRKPEERRAYNIYYYNRGNEFADVEMLVPDFESYDSYWKARTLIYVFRSHLYVSSEIEEALSTFTKLHQVSAYLNEEEKAQIAGERLFVLLLLKDRAGADSLFIELPKTIKGEVVRSETLSSFRTSLLVSGVIVGREDTAIDNVKTMLKILPAEANSTKLKTERRYYKLAYDSVKAVKPSFRLPELNFSAPAQGQE